PTGLTNHCFLLVGFSHTQEWRGAFEAGHPPGSESRTGSPRPRLRMQDVDAGLLCAMVAAENLPVPLHSVPDDATPAVLTGWNQGMDRALEAVIGAGDAVEAYVHRLVVVAPTRCAAWHLGSSPASHVWRRGADVGEGGPAITLDRQIPERDDADHPVTLVDD